jgi:hypothetical protein
MAVYDFSRQTLRLAAMQYPLLLMVGGRADGLPRGQPSPYFNKHWLILIFSMVRSVIFTFSRSISILMLFIS